MSKKGSMENTSPFVYILVVKEHNLDNLQLYLNNLKSVGVHCELEHGQIVEAIFIKVSICLDALRHYARVLNIGLRKTGERYKNYANEAIFCALFPTPVSVLPPLKEGELTNAETIMVVHQMLNTTKYGHKTDDYGLNRLKRKGLLMDSYPLHEDPASFHQSNDRSLLLRFWSRLSLMHKEQPLDLIQRYFGSEVGFYFAWLGYFNITLMIPSIIAVLVFLLGIVNVVVYGIDEITEVCTDTKNYVCPTCENRPSHCKFIRLSEFCSMAHWTYIFDNNFTFVFTIYMLLVATMFPTLWKRKEYILSLRWNGPDASHGEVDLRSAFREREKRRRFNEYTNSFEPYVPMNVLIFRYTISVTIIIILVIVILLILALNVATSITTKLLINEYGNKDLKKHKILIGLVLGSSLSLLYIKILSCFILPITLNLTNFENPRTETEYESSLIYKRFILSFINSLMPLFYLAFGKDHLYTVPHKNDFYFKQDVCQPLSCIVPLSIQITFLLTVRSFAGNLGNFLRPRIKKLFALIFNIKTRDHLTNLPQWEKEYFLEPCGRYFLIPEYSEMMVKYAIVTFFVGAFPLTPLCCLINNLTEVRSDAYKLVISHRRPVPRNICTIGGWNGILTALAYLCAATNAFLMAFTTDFFIEKYYEHNTSLHKDGFYNFTQSIYSTKDYPQFQKLENQAERCLYRGQYIDGGLPNAYHLDQNYWICFTIRYAAIFIFEHIVFLCNVVAKYLIPAIPFAVKHEMHLEQKEETRKNQVDHIFPKKTPRTELLMIEENYP